MIPEVLVSVLAGALSLLAGTGLDEVQRLLRRLRHEPTPPKTYKERLSQLTGDLTKASAELDGVLSELAAVATEREDTVRALEAQLTSLEARELELKRQIELLEQTPMPVAEHFARLLDTRDRRSARRDYVLFGAGVLVTTIVGIAVQLLIGA
jgi:hypothetical protein